MVDLRQMYAITCTKGSEPIVKRIEWDEEKNKRYYQKIAKAHGNKNRRVSLRMTEWDFLKIQEKAMREGLAYQSLLSSIVHKYLTGQLVEH